MLNVSVVSVSGMLGKVCAKGKSVLAHAHCYFLTTGRQCINPALAQEQLNKLEYIMNWGTITLQDAIDFCVLMTRTTESIQRFSDGTILKPGGIPGVGDEIDVAVITPREGFRWLKEKKLTAEGCEMNLEA